MRVGRLMILLSALVPYALAAVALALVALACWSAVASEPVVLPAPIPVPAQPSVGSEVASYATGGGAVGMLAVSSWLVREIVRFFVDIREHFRSEENLLGKVVNLLEKHEARIELDKRVDEELARRVDTGPISLEGRR